MSYTAATSLPVELLTTIFCFVGPSSQKDPYPYLRLCWVCRYWRDIVLNEPKFWSVLNLKKSLDYGFNKEVILRSECHALDVIVPILDWGEQPLCRLNEFVFFNERRRAQIRSLLCHRQGGSWPLGDFFFNLPNLYFPQLVRLSGSSALKDVNCRILITIITSSRLRYVDLPWDTLSSLHKQKLLHHLSRIEWLEITSFPLNASSPDPTPEILESLPNLQILIFTQNTSIMRNSTPGKALEGSITLPKLRLLSLNLSARKSWTFNAPKLDYLSILNFGGQRFYDWDHLGNINFSEISNICIGMHGNIRENDYRCASEMRSACPVACISGSDRLQLDCLPFQKFHKKGLISQVAVDGSLDLPPKNTFHISMPWTDFEAFDVVLKRTTNLVELTVNHGVTKTDHGFSVFLIKVLDSVGARITTLNIIDGRSLAETCNLIADGRRVPRLERLMYHNAFQVRSTAFLPYRLRAIQNARLNAGSSPLKILELKNFMDVPSLRLRVEEIGKIGIKLIQSA